MYSIKDENRFWSKILTGDINECWECVGMGLNKGYGEFSINSKRIFAHRFSYQLFHNRLIKEGMCILHSCDNPLCVNPNHLSEGTQQENITDRENKGRGVAPKGENQSSAKLKEFQVKEIRANYEKGQITYKQLANDYGVSDITIGHIIHRNTWKHI
jgi:hypothetical protein